MTEDLLRFRYDQKYLTFDCETENLNLTHSSIHQNKPWEIGYVLSKGKEILDEKSEYIWWPDLNIGDDAARITRFDYNIYKGRAKPAKDVYEKFAALLYDPSIIIVGQNVLNFDAPIIQNYRRALGLKPDWSFIDRVIDTRALSFAIQKGVKIADKDDLYCWQMRYMHARERGIKTSLESLMKYYSLPYDRNLHHDGLEDAKMTREVFFKQIYDIEI